MFVAKGGVKILLYDLTTNLLLLFQASLAFGGLSIKFVLISVMLDGSQFHVVAVCCQCVNEIPTIFSLGNYFFVPLVGGVLESNCWHLLYRLPQTTLFVVNNNIVASWRPCYHFHSPLCFFSRQWRPTCRHIEPCVYQSVKFICTLPMLSRCALPLLYWHSTFNLEAYSINHNLEAVTLTFKFLWHIQCPPWLRWPVIKVFWSGLELRILAAKWQFQTFETMDWPAQMCNFW